MLGFCREAVWVRTMDDKSGRWIEATPAASAGEAALEADQIASWRSRGFALVSGLLPEPLVDALVAAAAERFPSPGSEEAKKIADFGSNLNFPSTIEAFNELTLHPRLLGAVSELLDVSITDLRLSQSDLWPKYGREDRSGVLRQQDQRIHIDYPNHTLAHPAQWNRPEAVEMIVYLSDVADCGGATAVVPRTGADDPAYRWPIVRFAGHRRPGLRERPGIGGRLLRE